MKTKSTLPPFGERLKQTSLRIEKLLFAIPKGSTDPETQYQRAFIDRVDSRGTARMSYRELDVLNALYEQYYPGQAAAEKGGAQ